VRQHVLSTGLKDTWSSIVRQSQQCPEIEIVSEYDTPIRHSPVHDGPIRGARIANQRPVSSHPTVAGEHWYPVRGQIHVNQDLQAHATASGTSRSSRRQAA